MCFYNFHIFANVEYNQLSSVQNQRRLSEKLKQKLKLDKKAVLSQSYISGSNEPLRKYGHSKLSAACRQLGFDVTGYSAIRSADHKNPTLEPNMKCIGSPVAQIRPFTYLGGIWNPIWGEGKVVGVSDGTIRKSDGGSNRLSIVTLALSVTIRPQFAIECLRRSNQQGGGSLWAKI